MTDHGDLYWPWYGSSATAIVKLPDSPGPAVCPPQPFTDAPWGLRLYREIRAGFCWPSGCSGGCRFMVRTRCQGVAP